VIKIRANGTKPVETGYKTLAVLFRGLRSISSHFQCRAGQGIVERFVSQPEGQTIQEFALSIGVGRMFADFATCDSSGCSVNEGGCRLW
jgi:hypothetical protein